MTTQDSTTHDFDRLIDALRDPAVYAHPVAGGVETMETHISTILLAGDYVYKIKKPVDFGFVDFTTLDRRRHFCEEELRLNRRFAPELYLDVVPIRADGEGASFEGRGEILDYAVKMKRFDQDNLLDRCINKEGLITAEMIEVFAGDVAAVHADAGAAGAGDGRGTPDIVARNVENCWPPIRTAGLLEEAGEGPDLVAAMNTRVEACRPWIGQRVEDGHVRECHGDLHLGNLFLEGKTIRAFDCIEFNPDLSWIDVANDIAFFTMDLRFHDRAGFARRFRNAYLDATGDYSLLRVLRLYELYRALVRAKVASLREQEDPGAGKADAAAHLALAGELAGERTETPLILTHGLSGSGKTHVSTMLIEQSEAVRVRSDVARDRIAYKGAERYSDEEVEYVYQHLLETAPKIIRAGYPVIVDATFLKRARRDAFRRLAKELDVPFHILHCTAPDEELRRRITNRLEQGRDASEAGLKVLDLQLQQSEPLMPEEQHSVVDYDTTSPPPTEDILYDLSLWPAPHLTPHL